MEQVTAPEAHLPARQHGQLESSWVVNYMPMIVGAVSLLVLSTVGHAWLEMTTIASAAIIFVWLLFRLHFARKAGRAVRLRDTESGPELLAIRAIARSSLEELASISTEDMKGWRTGDPIAIRNLASVELRRMGLKPYQR